MKGPRMPHDDAPEETGKQGDLPQMDPKDIGCLRALEIFYAYIDGELDPAAAADFDHHMAHCRSCYSRAELEGLLTERLRKSAAIKASEGLKSRLRILMDNL